MQNCFSNPFIIVVIIVLLNQCGLLNTKFTRGKDAITLILLYLLWMYFCRGSYGYTGYGR